MVTEYQMYFSSLFYATIATGVSALQVWGGFNIYTINAMWTFWWNKITVSALPRALTQWTMIVKKWTKEFSM